MEVPQHNFTWQQGEDAEIRMIYKKNGVVTDLTAYSLRMDVAPAGSATNYTFNTDDEDTETVDEATLNSDGTINIVIGRSVTLSGGALFNYVGTPLEYDIFLRDSGGKQKKILKGTIMIEGSKTLWN